MTERLLSAEEVLARLGGVSRTSLWRLRREGAFPEPVHLSGRRIFWLESEFNAFLERRKAERDGVDA